MQAALLRRRVEREQVETEARVTDGRAFVCTMLFGQMRCVLEGPPVRRAGAPHQPEAT